jgi:predicted  nucleic acid-binding Zn-ribbon protein
MPKQVAEYKSPIRKVLQLLQQTRDKLRDKYSACREELRKQQNQVRAVEKSRAMWRRRAEAAETQLQDQKKTAAMSPLPGKT